MATDTLSDDAIALLCDIGEFELDEASPQQRYHLTELLSGGYLEIDKTASTKNERYRLTKKALDFISARGGGLNEA